VKQTTTIEVSVETIDILHSYQTKLAKILHKKSVSIDALLKCLFTLENSDTVILTLSELAREESIDKDMKE
jgi:hypothetical protein